MRLLRYGKEHSPECFAPLGFTVIEVYETCRDFPAWTTIGIETVFRDCLRFLYVVPLALSDCTGAKVWVVPRFCVYVMYFGTKLWIRQSTHYFRESTPYATSTIYTYELEAGKRRVTLHRPRKQLVNSWPAEFKQRLLVNVLLNYFTCIIIKSLVNGLALGKKFRKRLFQSCKGTWCEQRLIRAFEDEVKASACSSRTHTENILETQVRKLALKIKNRPKQCTVEDSLGWNDGAISVARFRFKK